MPLREGVAIGLLSLCYAAVLVCCLAAHECCPPAMAVISDLITRVHLYLEMLNLKLALKQSLPAFSCL